MSWLCRSVRRIGPRLIFCACAVALAASPSQANAGTRAEAGELRAVVRSLMTQKWRTPKVRRAVLKAAVDKAKTQTPSGRASDGFAIPLQFLRNCAWQNRSRPATGMDRY